MSEVQQFVDKVKNKEALIGIIGLGYVGLPLALRFSEVGFKVLGFDLDGSKIQKIHSGQSYIKHIDSSKIAGAVQRGFTATTDFSRAKEPDAILICVPTPLTHHREPDMSYIVNTANQIARYIRKGQLVVLESTTYPGTTVEILIPILEKATGLKCGTDFWAAFSPEREDPNNPDYHTATIPKVVGGVNPDALAAAKTLYDQVIVKTVPVSNTQTAEAAKLVENIFRCINIAMVNELKMVFDRMGIDIWEVIDAAKTKPFGFMAFYPGPGLGGHCIPIDPFYLTWKAREFGISTRFIELAGEINTAMPEYVVQRTMDALNDREKSLKGSKVLIVGLAYKRDIDDMRESPSLILIDLYEKKGAKVDYYDPYIPVVPPTREHAHLAGRVSAKLEDVKNYDVVVISTDHSNVDYNYVLKNAKLVVDTRNAIKEGAPNKIKA
ncbi:MAG: UDP-N-acetyl-D-glucosamine 6-dehydrogenase [Myxococcota bacterium]|nr:UDP-N-acetyl-D-glucosamine 6-dehydrogenase [Myxococcota bacterium]